MFNAVVHRQGVPRHLSTDYDPVFEAHRWTANLRILEIDELKTLSSTGTTDLTSEIARLEKKAKKLQTEIFSDLTRWQVVQLSRHNARPYFLDYVNLVFTDFVELAGDRHFAEDPSIVGGFARLDGEPVMVMGHQKGRNTKENMLRNFGMPRPEGYRKARRLMELADRFHRPVLTFIDTPGAYPGLGAEERGGAEEVEVYIVKPGSQRLHHLSSDLISRTAEVAGTCW